MGKNSSKHRHSKYVSANDLSPEEPIAQLQRIEERSMKRREERVANAESKYLPLQRDAVRKLKPGASEEACDIELPIFYNIGFFGMPAVGKSSLLNSVCFSVKGSLASTHKVQVVPRGFQGSYPTTTQQLRVTDHICLIAHRGNELEDILTSTEEVLQKIKGQLNGGMERSLSGASDKDSEMSAHPSTKKTHCAVVVISPKILKSKGQHYRMLINEIKKVTCYYPVGLITNFEPEEQNEVEATRGFFRSNGVDDIYDVENTHAEPLPTQDQIALLDMLERCVVLSDMMYVQSENVQ